MSRRLSSLMSIVTEHPQSLLRPLPNDGPAIDDTLLDDLYNEHMVSRVSMVLPNSKEIKRSDYVWFHLDTGATCTVSHCAQENHIARRLQQSNAALQLKVLPMWSNP
jgi:hypothetical protein